MYASYAADMVRNANSAYDMFQHEIWKWGIIQHSQRGWYHMDAEAESVLQSANIEPDTWVVPSRMRSYAAMGQHAETEVYRAGEKTARGNLELGKNNFSTFRGKKVYEVRPYQLDVDGRTVDPLNRTRMIGDFFIVPYFSEDNDGKLLAKKGCTQAYCCETDRFEKFSWMEMRASMLDDGMQSLPFENYKKIHTLFNCDEEPPVGGDGAAGERIEPDGAPGEGVGPARNNLMRMPTRPQVSKSKLSAATLQAASLALDKAIQAKYHVDPTDVQAAANSWARCTDADPAPEVRRKKASLVRAFESMIVELSTESLEELNESIHFDENGIRFTPAEVATDLYDGYLSTTGTHRGFDAVEASALHSEAEIGVYTNVPNAPSRDAQHERKQRLQFQMHVLQRICNLGTDTSTTLAIAIKTEIGFYANGLRVDEQDQSILPLKILGQPQPDTDGVLREPGWSEFYMANDAVNPNADLQAGLNAILSLWNEMGNTYKRVYKILTDVVDTMQSAYNKVAKEELGVHTHSKILQSTVGVYMVGIIENN